MSIADRFAAFVDYLTTEPVAVSYISAVVVTALLHYGISLSADATYYVALAAGAVATWAARRKVTPWVPPVPVEEVVKKVTAKKAAPKA